MSKNLIFLSGIPRSGSTVLSSMLNQHPDIHATTTSPISELISAVAESWNILSQAVVNQHPRQFPNIVSGILNSSYLHIDKPVIVDKNRLWPRFSTFLHQNYQQKPKIICTVRDIPEVLSSYILLLNKNPGSKFVDQDLIDMKLPLNTKNRCKILWEKFIFQPYTSLKIGVNSNDSDMIFVDYDEIVNDPQQTFDKICKFINIESYQVQQDNLKSMKENDEYHGGLKGLHEIRSQIQRTSPPPETVIGHDLVKMYRNMKLEFWKK